ncbi:hypothetical protein M405DRAFT_598189 [Rhizopogon salebrosus TDB-379]|nr:hypothetical protein M405DRAFT_598189 [Rhizopogon salebrosus TDB-379]
MPQMRGPAISLIFIVRISASLLRDHLVTVQQVSVGLGALLAAVSIHAVDVVMMILAGFDFRFARVSGRHFWLSIFHLCSLELLMVAFDC